MKKRYMLVGLLVHAAGGRTRDGSLRRHGGDDHHCRSEHRNHGCSEHGHHGGADTETTAAPSTEHRGSRSGHG